MAPRGTRDFLEAMSQEREWDILLLQECGDLTKLKGQVDGHKVFCSKKRTGEKQRAIIVHNAIAAAAMEDSVQDMSRVLFLDLMLEQFKVRVSTCHMPPGRKHEDYEAALETLTSAPTHELMHPAIIGIDAQDRAGGFEEALCKVIGTGAEEGRGWKGEQILNWCSDHEMFLASTEPGSNGGHTCDYDGKFEPRQIDYMMISAEWRDTVTCETTESCASRSDHRPIAMTLQIEPKEIEFYELENPKKKPIRWKKTEDNYQDRAAELMRIDPTPDFPEIPEDLAVDEFSRAVAEAGAECGRGVGGGPAPKMEETDERLTKMRELENTMRKEKDPVQRQKIAKELSHARRVVKRAKMEMRCEEAARSKRLQGVKRMGKTGAGVEVIVDETNPDKRYTDDETRKNIVASYFEKLYKAPDTDELPEWWERPWTDEQIEKVDDLRTAERVKEAIVLMNTGKTCAKDLVVVEMLQALSDPFFWVLAHLFKLMMISRQVPSTWDDHLVTLLKKTPGACSCNKLRPIAVLPVLYKVFSGTMRLMVREALRTMRVPQYAFRAGYSAAEVVGIFRGLVEKFDEWRCPRIFILDGDIDHAYDHTAHGLVLNSLDRRKVPRPVSESWIRCWRTMKSAFCLSPGCTTRAIRRTRSIPQGDPAGPDLFNVVVDDLAYDFQEMAARRDWGVQLNGLRVSIILFADNFWLFATSPAMLQAMLRAWQLILQKAGMDFKKADASWATTDEDAKNYDLKSREGHVVRRKPRGEGFSVLGCIVQFNNRFEKELANRTTRAWRTWGSVREILECKKVRDMDKVKLMRTTLEKSFFWCSGSWNLTAKNVDTVNALMWSFLRRMFPVIRRDTEETEAYMKRSTKQIKDRYKAAGGELWRNLVHKFNWTWGGHMVRLLRRDADRVSSQVLLYKDSVYLQNLAAANKGRQHHERILRVWRWERPFVKFMNASWKEMVGTREAWLEKLEGFVAWRSINR